MGTRVSGAELLAAQLPEFGYAVAHLNASAWSAGIDPDATRGLAGAATALLDASPGALLWARACPCPDEATFLEEAAELEAEGAVMLRHAAGMAAEAEVDRKAAAAQARGRDAGLAAQARQVIADCTAALEVLAGATARLEHARRCLARVPVDNDEIYEVPAGFVRDGGTLPFSGAYLSSAV